MIHAQKITPFLWFDGQAGEAADLYCSIFANSKIVAASPMSVTFELEGSRYVAFNGGPHFKFSEAVSFMVVCETQEEVDYYWDKLGDGGQSGRCGWLKDRFGLSWQIVPTVLPELLGSPDRDKAGRAMAAMMKMGKLEIAALRAAFEG